MDVQSGHTARLDVGALNLVCLREDHEKEEERKEEHTSDARAHGPDAADHAPKARVSVHPVTIRLALCLPLLSDHVLLPVSARLCVS